MEKFAGRLGSPSIAIPCLGSADVEQSPNALKAIISADLIKKLVKGILPQINITESVSSSALHDSLNSGMTLALIILDYTSLALPTMSASAADKFSLDWI